MSYIIILILLILSAVFSGLALGFFSISKNSLKRKAELGDKRAKKIYSIRQDGNLLLSTLIIANIVTNTSISVFLSSIIGSIEAILIAAALIVVFGEILPQAIFSRHALNWGSFLVYPTKFIIFLLYPLSKPIAFVLDRVLGQEIATIYSKKELIKIVEDQEKSKQNNIQPSEEKIVKGALSFSDKKVKDIMIPKKDVILLEQNQKLTQDIINKIHNSGHSRIPIYKHDKNNIVGMFYPRDLLQPNVKEKKVSDIMRKKVIFVDKNESLDSLLNNFRKNRLHLFIVLDDKDRFAGIVTVEDVFEQIIGHEIFDEFDSKEKRAKK